MLFIWRNLLVFLMNSPNKKKISRSPISHWKIGDRKWSGKSPKIGMIGEIPIFLKTRKNAFFANFLQNWHYFNYHFFEKSEKKRRKKKISGAAEWLLWVATGRPGGIVSISQSDIQIFLHRDQRYGWIGNSKTWCLRQLPHRPQNRPVYQCSQI